MYFTLFVTVLITAVFLVVAAYITAKLLGPRTYNKVKGEPFECGIPTHGSSWLPMHVGYYLFAILRLVQRKGCPPSRLRSDIVPKRYQ